MDGILNINKPGGPTSFSIVSKIKRLCGERRVGHAGTLDPASTGVLPVCLGNGTRIIEFLMDSTKTYRAEIELGTATDTYDSSGTITQTSDSSDIDLAQLKSALSSFYGQIYQVPPMFSALKHQGKPLYEWARAGITVERRSRPITIHKLEIINWLTPLVTVEVTCSKGTYIRSLAHDLGQVLGCGAYMKNLVRLKYGLFDIEDSVSIEQLEDAVNHGHWHQYVYPVDSVLSHWTAVVVGDDAEQAIINGRPVILDEAVNDNQSGNPERQVLNVPFEHNYCRAYSGDGRFLAVLRFDPEKEHWQPRKVFP